MTTSSTMTSNRHFEVRIKTISGGRHRMVIKAADEVAARREVTRWCKDNDKKPGKVTLWEVAMLPGTEGT